MAHMDLPLLISLPVLVAFVALNLHLFANRGRSAAKPALLKSGRLPDPAAKL
jgi:hypothetical protein